MALSFSACVCERISVNVLHRKLFFVCVLSLQFVFFIVCSGLYVFYISKHM